MLGFISIGGAERICSYYCDIVPSHLEVKTPSAGVKQYLSVISAGNKVSAPAEFKAKPVSNEVKEYNRALAAGEHPKAPETMTAKKVEQHQCHTDDSCEMMKKGISDCLMKG